MLQAALLFDIRCVNTHLSGHMCVTSMNWHTQVLINKHIMKYWVQLLFKFAPWCCADQLVGQPACAPFQAAPLCLFQLAQPLWSVTGATLQKKLHTLQACLTLTGSLSLSHQLRNSLSLSKQLRGKHLMSTLLLSTGPIGRPLLMGESSKRQMRP